ncbi:UNVERIFIED_CONTAM: hypothetical protein Scaly_2897600 [Sesamum calycinum]|uniref:Reverse transcriptase domain-containing protein n=1 Tax=Sesamum calycinum TaxID=2727403 RepID=A0AAW2L7P4_9LAMI
MYEIVNKLKILKAEFRRQRQIKGNLSENVKRANGFLDKAQELFATYKEDILLHLVKCCRQVYSEAIKLEISMLKQRAKLRWMTHGDQNSKVFFRKSLLGGSRSHRVLDIEFLRQDIKHILTTDEANQLVAPVTRSKIKAAFFDIDEDSAPGPDGYTSTFLELPGQWLDKQSLMLLETFSEQNAFVPGRNISDNILLAQELLAGYNQVRLPSRCTLKVDIQKAYDSVEWDFLLEVLRLFNFPPQFIKLIEQCVLTVSYSISLNGSIYGFFKGRRGLRQGDPMSPYLFVLVMEIWSSLLRPLINKLDARLAGWNHQNLSYAGGVHLIKSVLSTLHTYWASVFILPKGCYKTMEPQSGWTGFGATSYNIPHFGPLMVQQDRGAGRKWLNSDLCYEAASYKVGNGSTFRLWQDIWHDQGPLCLSHPDRPTITGLPMNSPLSSVLQQNQ